MVYPVSLMKATAITKSKEALVLHVWKEGKNIIVREDTHHITTYGKTMKEALENFNDAYLLNVQG